MLLVSHNKAQYKHSPIFKRSPIYTHQNGNLNPTSDGVLSQKPGLLPGLEVLGALPPHCRGVVPGQKGLKRVPSTQEGFSRLL